MGRSLLKTIIQQYPTDCNYYDKRMPLIQVKIRAKQSINTFDDLRGMGAI